MPSYRGARGSDGGWGSQDDQWGRSYGRSTNSAHNPYEVKMPRFLVPIYKGQKFPEDTSIVVVDNRDDRMVSPFQAWLVSEIMSNAASSINVLTERDQVMPPSSGFQWLYLPTIHWTGSRWFWRSRSRVRLAPRALDGMERQHQLCHTRLFSLSRGLCSGTPRPATRT